LKVFCRVVLIVTVVYLASGGPRGLQALPADGVAQIAAIGHLACLGLGLLGAVAAFTGLRRLGRGLMLWAVGLAALVCSTREYTVAYPTYFHVPVTFGGSYPNGDFYHFGIDLVPGALFVATWFGCRSRAASASPSAPDATQPG
jgi:hypothetical protein